VFDNAAGDRRGEAHDSIVCPGAILSGGSVTRSIVGPAARVNSYSQLEECILFTRVNVGRRCKLRRVIVDKEVYLPEGMVIGYDHDEDRRRGFTVSEGGVVVIAKGDGRPLE
jgi:glucose-1-phosphate adenylyltransferase